MKFRSAAFCAAAAAALVLIFFIHGKNRGGDDEAKLRLLRSRTTDYSTPEKYIKLKITEHTVKSGDNLNIIAKKYGVSIDSVCGSNNLPSYDLIHTGTVLRIPNKEGIIYRIIRGDRIAAVAARYRIPLEKLLAENSIRNPDFISVNSLIFIPDAKPQNVISGFLWPTGSRQITCGYGWRRNPFDPRFSEFHQGLDIRSSYDWVRASKYGLVSYTGWLGQYGRTVIIAHPGGWKTLYSHLSHIIVNSGQYVKQGQYIAKSGNTGRSTGAHLHLEVIKNGSHMNPCRYLSK